MAKPDVEQADYILVRPWPAFPQRCGEKKQQRKLSHNQYLKKITSAAQNGKRLDNMWPEKNSAQGADCFF